MEAIAPTRELFKKFDRDRLAGPATNQKQKRVAWKIICPFEMLYEQGKLDDLERAAGAKLARHYQFAQRIYAPVTSRYGQALDRSVDNSEDGDEATWSPVERAFYHSQKMDQAERLLDHAKAWAALTHLLAGERTLEDIGRSWMGCKSKQQSYIAGVALVRNGLLQLAKAWHLVDRPPD